MVIEMAGSWPAARKGLLKGEATKVAVNRGESAATAQGLVRPA
jgi:hypothetical protein